LVYFVRMDKTNAIEILGGTAASAASAIGITPQAFGQWPDVLTRRLEDRVIAAIARRRLPPEAFRPAPDRPLIWPDVAASPQPGENPIPSGADAQ